MTVQERESNRNYWILLIVAILTVIVLANLMTPDDDLDLRIENAAEEIGDGFEDAGRDLDPDRSTGDKVGDAIEDMGESVREQSE